MWGDTVKKGYLVLSNGKVFEGERFGSESLAVGEIAFTTSMTGYIESLSDPSFYGQIVVGTFPLMGDYGVMEEDMESDKPYISGFIVRQWCEHPSNFRMQGTIDEFMKKHGIVGLCSIDTRELTRIIREYGVMGAAICDEVTEEIKKTVSEFSIKGAVEAVSTKEKKVFKPQGKEKYRVTLIDYGTKKNIVRELNKRGCKVTVVPYDTAAEDILDDAPDGIMLSNGPGDPSQNEYSIEQLRKLVGKKPIFGICLGHQILALAMGAKTFKMKYGHRGENQPALDPNTGKAYITSQNHGYAVDISCLPKCAYANYINANDMTCEGLEYPGLNAFSVQFHPEGCGGPKDSEELFDRFISMMGGER